MNEPKATKIFRSFLDRFKRITKKNGFNTDVGDSVFDSRTYFNWKQTDEFPALSLFWPEERVVSITNTSVIQTMTVLVEGHAIADIVQPGATIRALIADIKQAALNPNDKNLGGLVHSIRPVGLATQPQEDGLHIVSVRLTYEIRYVETYGI